MMHLLQALLPLIAYLAIFQIAHQQCRDVRRAFVIAALIWSLSLTLFVESLSVPRELTRVALTFCWLATILICVGYLLTRPPTPGQAEKTKVPFPGFPPLNGWSRLLLLATAILMSLIGITALFSPPNTGDVVFYHMPRVVMWMSHRSVRFYPTLNYAQLIYGSWAEYAMLNLDLLFGGDRFVNLVQWFAYVGSAVIASLIARSLGARVKGQVLAAAICCAIPVAVLEGSGAKNNCVAAFWLASATYFLLEFRSNPSWGNTLGFGAAAALAIFTKGTAYLFLPALVAAGWWVSTPAAKRIFLKRLAILASLVLVVNFPLYVRNFKL